MTSSYTTKKIFIDKNITIQNVKTLNHYTDYIPGDNKTITWQQATENVLKNAYLASVWDVAITDDVFYTQLKNQQSASMKKEISDNLTREELVRDFNKLLGLPVIFYHSNDKENFTFKGLKRLAIGVVIGVIQEIETGRTMCLFRCYNDGNGISAVYQIENAFLRGISIQFERTDGIVTYREISVCSVGRRPGTGVFQIWNLNNPIPLLNPDNPSEELKSYRYENIKSLKKNNEIPKYGTKYNVTKFKDPYTRIVFDNIQLPNFNSSIYFLLPDWFPQLNNNSATVNNNLSAFIILDEDEDDIIIDRNIDTNTTSRWSADLILMSNTNTLQPLQTTVNGTAPPAVIPPLGNTVSKNTAESSITEASTATMTDIPAVSSTTTTDASIAAKDVAVAATTTTTTTSEVPTDSMAIDSGAGATTTPVATDNNNAAAAAAVASNAVATSSSNAANNATTATETSTNGDIEMQLEDVARQFPDMMSHPGLSKLFPILKTQIERRQAAETDAENNKKIAAEKAKEAEIAKAKMEANTEAFHMAAQVNSNHFAHLLESSGMLMPAAKSHLEQNPITDDTTWGQIKKSPIGMNISKNTGEFIFRKRLVEEAGPEALTTYLKRQAAKQLGDDTMTDIAPDNLLKELNNSTTPAPVAITPPVSSNNNNTTATSNNTTATTTTTPVGNNNAADANTVSKNAAPTQVEIENKTQYNSLMSLFKNKGVHNHSLTHTLGNTVSKNAAPQVQQPLAPTVVIDATASSTPNYNMLLSTSLLELSRKRHAPDSNTVSMNQATTTRPPVQQQQQQPQQSQQPQQTQQQELVIPKTTSMMDLLGNKRAKTIEGASTMRNMFVSA